MITSMKKKLIILMAAVMVLSVFCIPAPQAQAAEQTATAIAADEDTTAVSASAEASLAASASSEYKVIPLAGEGSVKVGGYYYYCKCAYYGENGSFDMSDFKIIRYKTKKGKRTVIYKDKAEAVTVNYGPEQEYTLKKRWQLQFYTNGTYIIFNEIDTETKKVTYWRLNMDGTNKTKLASATLWYFHPYSGSNWMYTRLMGVYRNYMYYGTPDSKDNPIVYKVNIKTGKNVRVKGLSSGKWIWGVFDGRYIYTYDDKKAYDCKTCRIVNSGIKYSDIIKQNDKLYAYKLSADQKTFIVYSVKNNHFTAIARIKSKYKFSYTEIQAVAGNYIYLRYSTEKNNKKVEYKYNMKTKKIKKIGYKEYNRAKYK